MLLYIKKFIQGKKISKWFVFHFVNIYFRKLSEIWLEIEEFLLEIHSSLSLGFTPNPNVSIRSLSDLSFRTYYTLTLTHQRYVNMHIWFQGMFREAGLKLNNNWYAWPMILNTPRSAKASFPILGGNIAQFSPNKSRKKNMCFLCKNMLLFVGWSRLK